MNASEFQKFVGRVVKMTEKKFTIRGREYTDHEYDENDPTICEIKQLAGTSKLRIMTSSMAGTCDYCPDRVNVKIDDDGCISNISNG